MESDGLLERIEPNYTEASAGVLVWSLARAYLVVVAIAVVVAAMLPMVLYLACEVAAPAVIGLGDWLASAYTEGVSICMTML